jgi:type I restriction enzyme S subunit
MANKVKSSSLSELCVQIADCPHSTPLWTSSGKIVLRNQNIRNGRLDISSPSFTDEAHFEQRSRRARLKGGDLVLTREAPMGEVCMVPDELSCCLGQRMVMLRADPQKCDPRFLLYAIQSPSVQHEILVNEGTGSTVSNLRIPLIEGLRIPTPSLKEQKSVASILGTIDEKIYINKQITSTLEALVQALFQSWFIDFDPVRARVDGRVPFGLDQKTAKLFPEKFNSIGNQIIPAGWGIKPLKEDINFLRGVEPGRDWYNTDGSGHKFIRVGDVTGKRESEIYTTFPTEIYSKLGDILVSFDGTPGAVTYCCEGIYSSGLRKIEGKDKQLHPCYLWCLSKSEEFQATIYQYATGTTILHASSAIPYLYRVVPSKEVTHEFNRKVDPIWSHLLKIQREESILIDMRNSLLPKLINGELNVLELNLC